MIYVDANYYTKTHPGILDVKTIELMESTSKIITQNIEELFKWEINHPNLYIIFFEIWEDDDETPLAHYTRSEAITLCNPWMKNCNTIWEIIC